MSKHPAAFINVLAETGKRPELVEWLQRVWDERCEFQSALTAAQALAERNRWIPVTERLPEPKTWVLVHNGKWTGIGKHVAEEEIESERWQDETTEFIEHCGPKVTHWMPLPEPPALSAKSEGGGR